MRHRIRTVSHIAGLSRVALVDVQSAARLVEAYDDKYGLWQTSSTESVGFEFIFFTLLSDNFCAL